MYQKNNNQRIQRIKLCLEKELTPDFLQIEDQSHLHRGHPGAKSGLGHFAITIESDCLTGLSRIKQHQRIYKALGDLMQTDIHALSINIRAK